MVGALNIGCLFLAQSQGLDPGLWKRGTVAGDAPVLRKGVVTTPFSWAEIFRHTGHVLPFSLPRHCHPTARKGRVGWSIVLRFEKGAAHAVKDQWAKSICIFVRVRHSF